MSAWQDLGLGLARWEVFARLGWFEVKRRYRRTIIGPLWGTLNLAVFILALGFVGGGILRKGISGYLPYLSVGMIMWVFISTVMNESCSLFIASQNLFRQMQLSYSSLAFALVWRNLIVFFHNIVAYLLFAILFAPHLFTVWAPLAIVGLAINVVNAVWVAMLLGMICLRFRDLQQLTTTFVQIAMFISPVFWTPDSLQGLRRLLFVELNPFYSLIEVVRRPLLGSVPGIEVYAMACFVTIVGCSVTFFFFSRFRKRIAYWA